jgi:hypothetical protein
LNRHRVTLRLDSEIGPGKVSDVRKLVVDHVLREVRDVQINVVFAVDAPALFDLLIDEAGDHVARRQVLERRSVPLGERLAETVP